VRHTSNPAGKDEVVRRLDGAEVAILGWTALGRRILSQLPGLRLIAVWATGYDYVNVAAASDQGSRGRREDHQSLDAFHGTSSQFS